MQHQLHPTDARKDPQTSVQDYLMKNCHSMPPKNERDSVPPKRRIHTCALKLNAKKLTSFQSLHIRPCAKTSWTQNAVYRTEGRGIPFFVALIRLHPHKYNIEGLWKIQSTRMPLFGMASIVGNHVENFTEVLYSGEDRAMIVQPKLKKAYSGNWNLNFKNVPNWNGDKSFQSWPVLLNLATFRGIKSIFGIEEDFEDKMPGLDCKMKKCLKEMLSWIGSAKIQKQHWPLVSCKNSCWIEWFASGDKR